MGQLRQDYQEFSKRGAEVIALGPDGPNAFDGIFQGYLCVFIRIAKNKF